ncbi:hypothetical protein [Streptomyces sp. NBC_00154]|uniref:hypothetical protein n=1 Tax=Streptomyces sp. NBC_00154 TaxID=2975670 RepID=UPI0022568ECA|nr:hypothetical protein [Streptomyces sp. NBC_00154]MCX5318128.1 hypothetical protein [Streptomyces sp. NBC_00154]
MDPALAAALTIVAGLLIVAVAAVLVTRFALNGTTSADRASVLTAVAELIRAIRGKR